VLLVIAILHTPLIKLPSPIFTGCKLHPPLPTGIGIEAPEITWHTVTPKQRKTHRKILKGHKDKECNKQKPTLIKICNYH